MICVKHKNVDRRTVHYNSDREKFKIIYYFVNVHRTFSNICPQDNDGKWGLAFGNKNGRMEETSLFYQKNGACFICRYDGLFGKLLLAIREKTIPEAISVAFCGNCCFDCQRICAFQNVCRANKHMISIKQFDWLLSASFPLEGPVPR